MIKRIFDFTASFLGLLILSPFLSVVCFLVWWQDFHSPFYKGVRVGRGEKLFTMVKLRSMKVNADKSGVDSTSANDNRITKVGHFIRRYKLDEFTQLWNVLIGDMSLVGPRPNVKRETDIYTAEEKKLLTVKPGITDFSSIVFADEGEILKDSKDPDTDYNQLIRPWKSRLGIFYIEKQSFWLDLKIIYTTIIAILSRKDALASVSRILSALNSSEDLIQIALREKPLKPMPPPGSQYIVGSRNEELGKISSSQPKLQEV